MRLTSLTPTLMVGAFTSVPDPPGPAPGCWAAGACAGWAGGVAGCWAGSAAVSRAAASVKPEIPIPQRRVIAIEVVKSGLVISPLFYQFRPSRHTYKRLCGLARLGHLIPEAVEALSSRSRNFSNSSGSGASNCSSFPVTGWANSSFEIGMGTFGSFNTGSRRGAFQPFQELLQLFRERRLQLQQFSSHGVGKFKL